MNMTKGNIRFITQSSKSAIGTTKAPAKAIVSFLPFIESYIKEVIPVIHAANFS